MDTGQAPSVLVCVALGSPSPHLAMPDSKVSTRFASAFPVTRTTWIGSRLEAGGQGLVEVRDYVMRIYAGPLMTFCRHSPMGRWSDPQDLVQGFLADRTSKADYFLRWRGSGKRLHQWLASGLSFYGREALHRKQREGQFLEVPDDLAGPEVEAHEALERATLRSFIEEAMRRAARECAQRGQAQHWQIFMQRSYGHESFRSIATRMNMTPEQAVVLMRTGKKRFLKALREVLSDDGVRDEKLPEELDWVLGQKH